MAPRQFGAKQEARGAVRRLIDLDCGLYSDVWGEVIMHRATDVSEDGLWVETDLLLEVGSEVTLTFYPPDWDEPLCVAGRVRRVELEVTSPGSASVGMGIAFEALRTEERRQLRQSMRCLRAEASYLLDQRTLVGVPVGQSPSPTTQGQAIHDPRHTVFGWGAPDDEPTDSAPSPPKPRRAIPAPPSNAIPDSQAFRGGLELAASVFGDCDD